jgi:hypothetical protein
MRERTGRRVGCTLPHSYSGAVEGEEDKREGPKCPPPPRLPGHPPPHPLAHPPPHLFACPLLYSPHASSSVSPLAFPLASAVVDGVRVLTWHGRLFAEGGRRSYWCCRLGSVWALTWHGWGMGRGVVVERARIADSTAFAW